MGMSWDTFVPGIETGRVYGQRGYMVGMNYTGEKKKLPDLAMANCSTTRCGPRPS